MERNRIILTRNGSSLSGPDADPAALEGLLACPHCDALYRARVPASGEKAVCARCHTVLIAPKRNAGLKILALTSATLILVLASVFFPFLRVSVAGVSNDASIVDTALSFQSGAMTILAIATVAMIVLIPVARMALVLYVLTPIVFDHAPWRRATHAFRLSQKLKPWSMAEIFALGCAVSLVKVAALAQIGFGPAFWMFTAVVIMIIISDRYLCTWSVWNSLKQEQA